MGKGYFAGIDSGSTSTDVVILDRDKKIVSSVIMPTGAGAANGAERALEEALRQSNLNREDIDAVVTTGYGRTAISDGDKYHRDHLPCKGRPFPGSICQNGRRYRRAGQQSYPPE